MKEEFPYRLYEKKELIETMNLWAGRGIPFLVLVDYDAKSGYIIPENEINPEWIKFSFNKPSTASSDNNFYWKISPVNIEKYAQGFDFVQKKIGLGYSFLTNYTQPTNIDTDLNISELYYLGVSRYKLWLKDQFVVFSPETFVRIADGKIFTYPMKGTIDADLPNAEAIILNDEKEKAEHATIVDLLRNDLSLVADNVKVTKYRYLDKIQTNQKNLLQVSSEISGILKVDYISQLGDILFSLLPAGSVTGAPKASTLKIIAEAEGYERGFYTGICGYFDGKDFDSAVMIRFIEQTSNGLVFKSGGGITAKSELEKEYNELIQKVYVPIS